MASSSSAPIHVSSSSVAAASVPSSSAAAASAAAAAAAAAAAGGGTSSPCAACKFLRRKCQPDCVFAPYFPPDNPQKFVHVHRVFGASNVTKLLNELHPYQREDAVNSLAYEADMRLRDPVYGCVGVISILQHQLRQLQMDLTTAKSELSKYQAAAAAAAAAASAAPSTANFIGGMSSGPPGGSGAHTFMNMNHPIGIGISSGGSGGFGRDQFFSVGMREQQAMMRGYDDMTARVAAMSAVGMGPLGGGGGVQFLRPSAAGGDERPSSGP
ncbi:LOB domain-containing protein 6 [Ananas comosus]|uniref:LOB domain-containing protein 6 n=1 Tax=Ananas comosus TaxID=4615 RepID=A0A6P5F0N3_ANACO|nr:LOB domain-containing protein 6 [Ananas comosus]XP_020086930.1 LOB domain-containing protein 6 [Ananas comosus]XP_020086938.1 LOB domain-containing protein 6 [Ananas comosus]